MNQKIAFFILLFFLSACSSEVVLNDLPVDHKLVLNSLITPDQPIIVSLSSTIPASENIYPEIDNATVSLYKNDVFIENLTSVGHGKYQATHTPEPGATYTLTAEAPGYEPVKATEKVQKSVIEPMDVTGFSYECRATYIEDMEFGSLQFDLQDYTDTDANTNYYEIIIIHSTDIEDNGEVRESFGNVFYVSNEAVDMRNFDPPYPNTILFTNKAFAGRSIHFNIFSNSSSSPLKIRKVSAAYYQYKTTMYLHRYNQIGDDVSFFGQGSPVPVFSNVQNGYGIFASYSEYVYNYMNN